MIIVILTFTHKANNIIIITAKINVIVSVTVMFIVKFILKVKMTLP